MRSVTLAPPPGLIQEWRKPADIRRLRRDLYRTSSLVKMLMTEFRLPKPYNWTSEASTLRNVLRQWKLVVSSLGLCVGSECLTRAAGVVGRA